MRHFLKKNWALPAIALWVGCGGLPTDHARTYAASIEPAGMILREVVGDRAEVGVLLPAGASPHHYEPSPSNARFAEEAIATFYFDPTVDAWAARLAGNRAALVFDGDGDGDGEAHTHDNPHVWLDPIAVRDRLPTLVAALVEHDPEGESVYRDNAQRFADRLEALDRDVANMLSKAKGLAVIEAHPSWDRFLERYGIRVAGVLEPVPGTSLPPRRFAELSQSVTNGEVFAIISEPQLPRGPLETLTDGEISIVELDPLGGRGDLLTYDALIRVNAQRLAEVLP
jgi:zinc transport system substrate-binding protein